MSYYWKRKYKRLKIVFVLFALVSITYFGFTYKDPIYAFANNTFASMQTQTQTQFYSPYDTTYIKDTNQLYGSWQSNDNGIITFNTDGTGVMSGYVSEKYHSQNKFTYRILDEDTLRISYLYHFQNVKYAQNVVDDCRFIMKQEYGKTVLIVSFDDGTVVFNKI